jgi:hypothetical protein
MMVSTKLLEDFGLREWGSTPRAQTPMVLNSNGFWMSVQVSLTLGTIGRSPSCAITVVTLLPSMLMVVVVSANQ